MNRPPRSTVIPLLLVVGLLGVCCLISQYDATRQWFIDKLFNASFQRESRQRFRDTVADVSTVTDDTLVSESQREIDTSGMCFSAEAQQIFGTNRTFDAVLAEYSADLPEQNFSQSDCEKVFRGTDDSALAITKVSTDELNCYGIEQAEYRTYYRVILFYSTGCSLSDIYRMAFSSVGCSSGSYTWPSQNCPEP